MKTSITDSLLALGSVVAGVLTALGLGAGLYYNKSKSDAAIAERREAEVEELIRLKDQAREEVERQRDALAADNEKLKAEIDALRKRMDTMERQISSVMAAVASADVCANAPHCPNRRIPKGASS